LDLGLSLVSENKGPKKIGSGTGIFPMEKILGMDQNQGKKQVAQISEG